MMPPTAREQMHALIGAALKERQLALLEATGRN